jgi:hypothetical protein
MQFPDFGITQGSQQEFMPLKQLYDKNMAFAIEHRQTLEDGVPEDTEPCQTRLRKQRHAYYVEWFSEMKQRTIPKIDALIAALPGMLADAEKQHLGPNEVWKMRGRWNCCCEENSVSCCGHVFDMDQYFLASSDYHQSGLSTPDSPSSPRSPE